MASRIFINLPVKNVGRSVDFFTSLGFTFNTHFTDDQASCMIISENIFAILLIEERFRSFTGKAVADAKSCTEVLIALDVDSREEVDEMVRKAVDAGGSVYSSPQDQGWMYGHSFADPDGHQWEVLYISDNPLPEE